MEQGGTGRVRGIPSAEVSERELVTGLLSGQAEAVSVFLQRTHHPVYCLACRLTRDREQRHDWSQEVLLGVLGDIERGRFVYTRPGSFWAWFRKRAYYRLLDEYRRSRKRWEREGGASSGQRAPDLDGCSAGGDPLAELERCEVLEALEACIRKLPSAHQRSALEMLLLRQMDYQAIAESLAAPLNTVKAWIRRGRLAVRKCLIRRLGLPGCAASGTPGR
jgi:RNA polymerase sigma factor (sigma-70 family)